MIRIGFLWLVAGFCLVYFMLVGESFIQEYVLDNFFYWGFPQWGWMYASPKIYLWFNIFYLLFLAIFILLGIIELLKHHKQNAFIYLGCVIVTVMFFYYAPESNWNKQFAIFNAEKTIENSRVPEGKWWVSAQNMDRFEDQNAWSKLKGKFGRGLWPGGYPIWGEYRIWLRPDMATNTKGRRGLVFHGGEKNASPWGIDMGKDIVDFAIRLRQSGQPLDIVISYGQPKTNTNNGENLSQ